MSKKVSIAVLLPMFLSFFVMSFADLVGTAKDYVQDDFQLSETISNFIASAAFLWFFVFSVPTGILQGRFGKKNMLNLGMVLSAVGLILPFIFYKFHFVLIGFCLIGIGNTIIQVSANPLLIDLVPQNKAASSLSFSQFIKALGSMVAAPLAAWCASAFGDWKLVFPIFAVVSLLSVFWLASIKVEESKPEQSPSVASCLSLLGNPFILLMFLCIFLVVGIDVGVNAGSGSFLMDTFGMDKDVAASGRSVYFFGKLVGCLTGALILTLLSTRKFLLYSTLLGLASLLVFIFNGSEAASWPIIFIIGLGFSNVFPMIFTLAVERLPSRSGEISGLMMMAIAGGAVIPPLMGVAVDGMGTNGGMYILVVCTLLILAVSLGNMKEKKN